MYILEKSSLWIVMFISIFGMSALYIIPAILCFGFFIFFFHYTKESIIAANQLSLKTKNPVFSQLREMTRGLVPLKIYGQISRFTENFIKSLNICLEASICFIILERAFGVFVYYGTVIILLLGMELGALGISP